MHSDVMGECNLERQEMAGNKDFMVGVNFVTKRQVEGVLVVET